MFSLSRTLLARVILEVCSHPHLMESYANMASWSFSSFHRKLTDAKQKCPLLIFLLAPGPKGDTVCTRHVNFPLVENTHENISSLHLCCLPSTFVGTILAVLSTFILFEARVLPAGVPCLSDHCFQTSTCGSEASWTYPSALWSTLCFVFGRNR